MDYLREFVTPFGAWFTLETERLEHRWARLFSGMSDVSSVPGFGCSDCTCDSHLFKTVVLPDFDRFVELAGGCVESWSCRPADKRCRRRPAV